MSRKPNRRWCRRRKAADSFLSPTVGGAAQLSVQSFKTLVLKSKIMRKTLIPYKDYRRIFCTIYSILHNENVEINHSCIYFSVIGSLILHGHYKMEPKVYMGISAYMIDNTENNVLAFAEKDETSLQCSENGFHSWIIVSAHP
jgi:hypothetical protein